MATRRMTSLEVINTDAFLDMPQSSQLLYFHLNARADDDGFVSNPKSIMRNCGAQGDDIKLLIAKKFLINFEDGVCVIKHWRINNYIRKDIYNETKYLNHKQILFIRPNGAYTLTDDGQAVPVPRGHFQLESIRPKSLKNGSTGGQNNVHESSTERALSIGKDRLGNNTEDKSSDLEEERIPIEEWEADERRTPRKKELSPLGKRFAKALKEEMRLITSPSSGADEYVSMLRKGLLSLGNKESEMTDDFLERQFRGFLKKLLKRNEWEESKIVSFTYLKRNFDRHLKTLTQ